MKVTHTPHTIRLSMNFGGKYDTGFLWIVPIMWPVDEMRYQCLKQRNNISVYFICWAWALPYLRFANWIHLSRRQSSRYIHIQDPKTLVYSENKNRYQHHLSKWTSESCAPFSCLTILVCAAVSVQYRHWVQHQCALTENQVTVNGRSSHRRNTPALYLGENQYFLNAAH